MIQNVSIDTDLFIARPLQSGDGYTWTLASRLGDMLFLAEKMFGPRDQSYTILGTEFCNGEAQLWYPGNRGHIIIQLNNSCMTDIPQACYQLAHECVHLLSPSGGRHANVLEEGLATHFARSYVRKNFGFDMMESIPSYTEAREACEQLLNLQSNIIPVLRLRQPAIRLISEQDIIDIRPDCPQALAQKLTTPFIR
jgi:hypothetical protein